MCEVVLFHPPAGTVELPNGVIQQNSWETRRIFDGGFSVAMFAVTADAPVAVTLVLIHAHLSSLGSISITAGWLVQGVVLPSVDKDPRRM